MPNGWGGKRANAGRKPKHTRTPSTDSPVGTAAPCPFEQMLELVGYPKPHTLRTVADQICREFCRETGMLRGSPEMEHRLAATVAGLKAHPEQIQAVLASYRRVAPAAPAEASPLHDSDPNITSDSSALKKLD